MEAKNTQEIKNAKKYAMMILANSFYGKIDNSIMYRLAFNKDGSVSWIGTHPFYGTEFPPMKVEL